MRRFEEISVIGDGAFGVVTKCRDKETGDIVAIKKMKQRYASFEECLQLKEIKSLRKIKHENVVKLLQVFREYEYLYLVFEFLPDGNLLKTLQNHNGPFSEPEIRFIISQLLSGLNYVHRQGFFHRDIKPENLLWSGNTLKIADFGLAREIRSRPPYTEYVSTRWYRAPEIILRHEFYNSPVDIWAVGAIMAELYMRKPLFQGTSENDQLFKIIGILGTPNSQNWPDSVKLINKLNLRLPQSPPVRLSSLMPDASPDAISLMTEMLRYDPSKRPSAAQALQHPFFKGEKAPLIQKNPFRSQSQMAPKKVTTDILSSVKPMNESPFTLPSDSNNYNANAHSNISNNNYSNNFESSFENNYESKNNYNGSSNISGSSSDVNGGVGSWGGNNKFNIAQAVNHEKESEKREPKTVSPNFYANLMSDFEPQQPAPSSTQPATVFDKSQLKQRPQKGYLGAGFEALPFDQQFRNQQSRVASDLYTRQSPPYKKAQTRLGFIPKPYNAGTQYTRNAPTDGTRSAKPEFSFNNNFDLDFADPFYNM
ncbi:putative serine/threonine-protein kinase [Tritrichomonas foetus]|uniref:Serine/threonine-protein kinase n=1 Tax=Tritrichomonas foetus TaxID=1144522 RepID=A0A1J4JQI3_9EUKA|nr:putative serine/threonine-protein kinase [Tritrichomonas foetus]|eukprot:OHT01377.1 putative serine/threonine-protein kinase [Tritrichomonas foetus]